MKNALLGIIAAVMLLTMETSNTFSPDMAAKQNYVNSNKNSISDYSDNTYRYTDIDNDGICDYCDEYHGNCLNKNSKHFVDNDGDGICDYCGECDMTETRQNGHHIDTHNNGNCDNYSNVQNKRSGHGHHYQERHCR